MSALTLEPLAVRQVWTASQPLESQAWAALFAEYLGRLAETSAQACAGPCVIGHIKLLALFGERGYLRVSAVSATHPPTVTGVAPEGLNRIETTLNVLVYGLPVAQLTELTSAAAAAVAARHGLSCRAEAPVSSDEPAEGTHHAH